MLQKLFLSSCKYFIFALLISLVLVLTLSEANAFPKKQMVYKGRLTNSSGQPVPNGNYDLTFTIYQGSSSVWSESQSTAISNGLVTAVLGSSNPINIDFNEDNAQYYLGIKVGADSEMTPRQPIGAAPFALNSQKLNGFSEGTGANNLLKLGSSGQIDIAGFIRTTNTLQAGDSTLSSLLVQGNATINGTLTAPNIIYSVNGTPQRVYVSGGQNPTVDIDSNYAGQTSINTVGTITNGTWHGSELTDPWVSDYITVANYLPLAGGTMQGDINMNWNDILNIANLTGTTSNFTNSYTTNTYTDYMNQYHNSNITYNTDLNMNNHDILNVNNLYGNNETFNNEYITNSYTGTLYVDYIDNYNNSDVTYRSDLNMNNYDITNVDNLTSNTIHVTDLYVTEIYNTTGIIQFSGDLDMQNYDIYNVDQMTSHSYTDGTMTITGGIITNATWQGNQIDISDYTNLTATGGVTLTNDTLSHTAGNGWSHIPQNGSASQILQYNTPGEAKWVTVSGDGTINNGGALIVYNDSHTHSGSTLTNIMFTNWGQICADGQVPRYNAGTATWACSNDVGTTYTADGQGIELLGTTFSLELDGSTLSKSGLGLKVSDSFASNFLTTSTVFGGDVSGNYNNITVANDSHLHTGATISDITFSDWSQLCANNQIPRYNSGTGLWECSNDGGGTAYTAGDGLQLVGSEFSVDLLSTGGLTTTGGEMGIMLDGATLTLSGAGLKVSDNYDDNFLTTTTAFLGDVTGTYNSTVVGNDSHSHTGATLSSIMFSDWGQTCANNQIPRYNSALTQWECADATGVTYTAGDGLQLIGTEFSVDLLSNGGLYTTGGEMGINYNSTNLQIVGNVLNTIQNISTTSSPTFAQITLNSNLRIRDASGNYYTTFQGGTQSSNIVYTLPINDGTSNQVLTTDGNGILSWTTVSGGTNYWTDGGTNLYPTNRESIRVYDSTGVDYIDIAHDGTDAVLSFAGTTALNVNINTWDLSNQNVSMLLSSSTNSLNIGSNLLSLDTSNNRVGIFTNTPTQTLDVNGDIELANYIYFQNGTTNYIRMASDFLVSNDWDPTVDNTYDLGTSTLRWRDINLGPGSVNVWNQTGTNYELGELSFAGSNTALSLLTSAGGTGTIRPIQIATGSNNGIFVATDGNVGINTTTPTRTLESNDASNPQLRLTQNYAGGLYTDLGTTTDNGGTFNVWPNSGYTRLFSGVNYTELNTNGSGFIINPSSGRVGIGTTTPSEQLSLSGRIALQETTTPSATSNFGKIYVKTDSKLYYLDENGGEFDLTASATASPWTKSGSNIYPLSYNTDNVAIGKTTAQARLDIQSTSTQLRLSYNDTNRYVNMYADTNGSLNIIPTGVNGWVTLGDGVSQNGKLNVFGSKTGEFASSVNAGNQVRVFDYTEYNQGTVAGISLWGKYDTAGNQMAFGGISAGKENLTSGDARGYLSLRTQDMTGSIEANREKLRINSYGYLLPINQNGWLTMGDTISQNGRLNVFGSKYIDSVVASGDQVKIYDYTEWNQNPVSGISLYGKYNSAGNQIAFGGVTASKENLSETGDAAYRGYLSFRTQDLTGTTPGNREKLRLSSYGYLLPGVNMGDYVNFGDNGDQSGVARSGLIMTTGNKDTWQNYQSSGGYQIRVRDNTAYNNNPIAGIALGGRVATGWNNYASINAGLESIAGNGKGFLAFATQTDTNDWVTEKMRITSGGNIGINTITPADFRLQVKGDVGPDADNQYSLGSPTKRWANLYANYLYLQPMATGSVLFIGASGQMTQDNDNFYWNDGTNQLGINLGASKTWDPSFAVQVNGSIGPNTDNASNLGSSSKRWANIYGNNVYASSYLGINTLSPSQRLDVAGDIELANTIYFANAGTEYLNWDNSNFNLSDDLLPTVDLTYSLGSSTKRWSNIFSNSITTYSSLIFPNMTQGSVLFAGAGGLVSEDNANLFWDDAVNSLIVGDRLGNNTSIMGNQILTNMSGNGNSAIIGANSNKSNQWSLGVRGTGVTGIQGFGNLPSQSGGMIPIGVYGSAIYDDNSSLTYGVFGENLANNQYSVGVGAYNSFEAANTYSGVALMATGNVGGQITGRYAGANIHAGIGQNPMSPSSTTYAVKATNENTGPEAYLSYIDSSGSGYRTNYGLYTPQSIYSGDLIDGYNMNVRGNMFMENPYIEAYPVSKFLCLSPDPFGGPGYVVEGCASDPSSIRFKNNVVELSSANVNKLYNLMPVSYNWKNDGKADVGFIAEDAALLFPELIKYDDDGIISGFDYSHLSAYEVLALKQQKLEIDDLGSRLAIIESLLVEESELLEKIDVTDNIISLGNEVLTVNTETQKVGILTSEPEETFSIGAGSEFSVNSTGDLVKINGVPYSWPDEQGAPDTYLKNDGNGNLSWSNITPSGSSMQYIGSCEVTVNNDKKEDKCNIEGASWMWLESYENGSTDIGKCIVNNQGTFGVEGFASTDGADRICKFLGFTW